MDGYGAREQLIHGLSAVGCLSKHDVPARIDIIFIRVRIIFNVKGERTNFSHVFWESFACQCQGIIAIWDIFP